MIEEKDQERTDSDDSFDLEIESEPDTDEIMREAVEAVESHRRDLEAVTDERRSAAPLDEDGAVEARSGEPTATDDVREGLERQLKQAQDRTVRALADYENFRRRVERERVDYSRYAAEGALSEFLPVLDNLTRALDAEGGYEDLKSGVEMIHRQMGELLGRFKVVAVPSVGERFDPSVHEAVAKVEDAQYEQPTVLEEFQTGYVLHDRLLRPAMVRVAVPAETPSETKAEIAQEVDENGEGDDDV